MKCPSIKQNSIILFISICLLSCKHSSEKILPLTPSTTTPGAWDLMPVDFNGIPRTSASYFSIGDTVYVGIGYNYEGGTLTDFWKVDPVNNLWHRKSDFPGVGRSKAVAFSLNGKGYIGTGIANDLSLLKDFYEFDPTTGSLGTWKKIADFPTERLGAVAFTVNNRSFVGTGHNNNEGDLMDFWEYDQNNDAWISREPIAGRKRQNAFVMVIDNIAYIGGGTNNEVLARDFLKFDVTKVDGNLGAWTQLNAFTGKDINGNILSQPEARQSAATFTIDGKGYLVSGYGISSQLGDTWQYDPLQDTWKQFYSFTVNKPISGSPRSGAVGFALTTPSGTFGYLTTGSHGQVSYDDYWRFDPKGKEPDNN